MRSDCRGCSRITGLCVAVTVGVGVGSGVVGVGVGSGVGVRVGWIGVLARVWRLWMCSAAKTWAGADGLVDVWRSAPFEECGSAGHGRSASAV